jgi:hypothetical protein
MMNGAVASGSIFDFALFFFTMQLLSWKWVRAPTSTSPSWSRTGSRTLECRTYPDCVRIDVLSGFDVVYEFRLCSLFPFPFVRPLVFVAAQQYRGLPIGTIRAAVLLETIPVASQMEDILYH